MSDNLKYFYISGMPFGIDVFLIVQTITKGAYGKVYLGQKKNESFKYYAIKVMSKKWHERQKFGWPSYCWKKRFSYESLSVYCSLILLFAVRKNVYLVMDYFGGGDLKTF